MKDSFILWFLYKTVPGRAVLKILVQPKISRMTGYYLSSRASKWLVPYYIKKYKIDMSNIDIPKEGFSSFNAFFTRKYKIKYYDLMEGHIISPCDGLLSTAGIGDDMFFDIKNTIYSLEDLLDENELVSEFKGGTALIFRLTPADYHRYCYAAGGRILQSGNIPGKLHCVRPIALRSVPVFARNSREYQVIKTNRFGIVIQMEVGALLVGKINNRQLPLDTQYVLAGEEKGCFEFGGSTIILLFQKNMIQLNKDLFKRQSLEREIPVNIGEYIAHKNME